MTLPCLINGLSLIRHSGTLLVDLRLQRSLQGSATAIGSCRG